MKRFPPKCPVTVYDYCVFSLRMLHGYSLTCLVVEQRKNVRGNLLLQAFILRMFCGFLLLGHSAPACADAAIPVVSEFTPETVREMTRKVAAAGAMPSVLPEATGATGAARALSVMKTIRAIEVATNVVERKALESLYVAQVAKIGTTVRTDGLWASGITNGVATGVAPDLFVSALNVKVLAWGVNQPIKMMWLDSHRVPVIRGWRALCRRVGPDSHLQAEGMNPETERLAALAFQLAGQEVEPLAVAMLQPMPFVQTAEYQQDLADQKRLLAEAPPVTSARSLELMRRACGWQQEHLFTGRSSDCHDSDTCWFRGTLFAGVVAAYRATKDEYYRTLAVKLGEKNQWKPGPNALRDGNDFAITQSYLDLFLMEKKSERLDPSRAVMNQLLAEKERPRWGWCDALFMAPAAFARMSVATGDARYRDWMHRQWWQTVGSLYDPDEHLFVRDRTYLPFPDGVQMRERNGKKVFWGRGNGWVFGGLCRVLEALPADDPLRPRYEQLLREMAKVLITAQGKDGLWRASLQDPESYPLGETSGSTFFCYGLAWGVNHGVLDKSTCQPVVLNAWRALLACVDPDGKLGFVQQPADSPRSATYRRTNSEYATGALLLAGSEVLRLL
jgi:rhamnogalacturonyl hydrolase YesR